jgi:hypothetical protein
MQPRSTDYISVVGVPTAKNLPSDHARYSVGSVDETPTNRQAILPNMPEDAEKPPDRNFNIGDIVLDRDADEESAAYVTTLPDATADEWIAYEDEGEEITVAEDNPDYPADAPVVVVVHTTGMHLDLQDWNRYTPLSVDELEEVDTDYPLYYSFPAQRLVRDKKRPHGPEAQRKRTESGEEGDESATEKASASDGPPLTDIQHVGEGRAEELREAGYESVEDVATTDQSAVAEIDGIGETRAGQITASATDLLDEQSDTSEADTADEPEPDTIESRETTEADTDPSAALVALQRYLKSDGMNAGIADDGQSVRVTKAADSYRVSLDGVEGDGPHRSQLEEAVEKVRAATEATEK